MFRTALTQPAFAVGSKTPFDFASPRPRSSKPASPRPQATPSASPPGPVVAPRCNEHLLRIGAFPGLVGLIRLSSTLSARPPSTPPSLRPPIRAERPYRHQYDFPTNGLTPPRPAPVKLELRHLSGPELSSRFSANPNRIGNPTVAAVWCVTTSVLQIPSVQRSTSTHHLAGSQHRAQPKFTGDAHDNGQLADGNPQSELQGLEDPFPDCSEHRQGSGAYDHPQKLELMIH